ncbi:MAG: DUF3365 domain-containing protein [Pseudomonadota bacterium]
MNAWKRLSLTSQYLLVGLVVIFLMVLVSVTLARDVNVSAKLNEARTVTDMVENIGAWASQYRGLWARKDAADPTSKVGDFLNQESAAVAHPAKTAYAGLSPEIITNIEAAAITFHQKNPALIQREVSQVTEKSDSKAKFRMTSDKFMNPDNAPNNFESEALGIIRTSGKQEYYEVTGAELLYARKITATVACLKCHDTPEKAPVAVREKYPALRGYGYRDGEIIGVISVKLPLDNVTKTIFDNLSWTTRVAVGGFFLVLFLLFYAIRQMLILPLRLLRKYADDIRDSDPASNLVAPKFVDEESTSKNEIHQLNQGLKAMHDAIKILIKI